MKDASTVHPARRATRRWRYRRLVLTVIGTAVALAPWLIRGEPVQPALPYLGAVAAFCLAHAISSCPHCE